MIEYLEYKGKKLPISVGIYAINKSTEETGLDFFNLGNEKKSDEITNKLNNVNIYNYYLQILKYSLISGHKIEDIELSINDDELPFILDLHFSKIIELLAKFNK